MKIERPAERTLFRIPMHQGATNGSIAAAFLLLSLTMAGCFPATRVETVRISMKGREALHRSIELTDLSSARRAVMAAAEGWLGTPYLFGGLSRSGVDCSGFICNVYETVPLRLPRNSAAQATVGQEVDIENALPGDLVFFNTTGAGVSHVGILINSDQFVHASTSSGVIVSSLSESYYRDRFLFLRRVFEN